MPVYFVVVLNIQIHRVVAQVAAHFSLQIEIVWQPKQQIGKRVTGVLDPFGPAVYCPLKLKSGSVK